MRASTAETLAWVFIYGGLLLATLGLFVDREGASLGVGLVVLGALATLAGIVLIWLRSRMPP